MENHELPTELLRALYRGRVYSERRNAVSVERMADTLCPPFLPCDQFLNRLHELLERAGRNSNPVVEEMRNPLGECQVRIVDSDQRILATCAILTSEASQPEANEKLTRLSERERQVLDLLASGLTNKQIAASLFLSPRTIEKHRARVHQKTGTRSLAVLTKLWLTAGPHLPT